MSETPEQYEPEDGEEIVLEGIEEAGAHEGDEDDGEELAEEGDDGEPAAADS